MVRLRAGEDGLLRRLRLVAYLIDQNLQRLRKTGRSKESAQAGSKKILGCVYDFPNSLRGSFCEYKSFCMHRALLHSRASSK
jgi:hypothetical protein